MAKPAKSKGLDVLIDELEGSLWVASVESGRLEGLDVDPAAEQVRWGSIYWAKVARIDAAQDAAYVNLDGDNIGILYNADVRIEEKDGKYKKGGDIAIGKAIQPGQMIAVQAKSGYLPRAPEEDRAEDKNPRVSMNVVLSGRYLIHTPTEPDNRVSQRIRDKKLRRQLMKMLEQLGNYHGCILRAAAAGVQTDVLLREAKVLRLTWDQVKLHFKGDDPSLIMLGPDAVQRTMSDHAGKPVDRIELTTMEHFEHAEEWCEVFAPDLMTKIQPVELKNPNEELGLFDLHDIAGQIDELFQPYTILENGGAIIIQETAALIAIDVNRGADERSNLAINLQAAEEIARHLRLRNMGGAVVIDFLRMKSKEEYKKLEDAMERFFIEKDPCTVQIHGITKLGFMELTRQRRTPSLLERYRSVVSVE
ncbi:MAG: ribonuclease E/G [Proteobacteria bacterium]|nr:ribonuclease E/G [Pseudomonadota bacterium]